MTPKGLLIIRSYIILMSVEDYPLNEEIEEMKKAVEELRETNDIGALMMAESDLNGMLQKRAEWLKKHEHR